MNLKQFLFVNNSSRQILAKNTFWLGMIEVISKLIMFFVTIAIGRYLGLAGFGTYNFVFSFVALLTIFSDLGVGTVLTREVAKHRDQAANYLGNALSLRIFTSILIILLMFISLFFFGQNRQHLILIVLATASVLSQQFLGLLSAVLTAFEKMEYVFITKSLYFIGVLISALVVIRYNLGVNSLVSLYTAISIIAVTASLFLINRLNISLSLRWQKDFIVQILLESLPVFGFLAASQIYANLDTLLISKYFGNQSVGLYSAAYKILYAFQSINIINSATFPRISVLIHEHKSATLEKIIKLIIGGSLLVLIPLALIISLKSTFIVSLIWRDQNFIAAAPILIFLIWSGVFNYFRIFTTNLLIARGQQKFVFFSILFGLAVNAVLNIFVMPMFGFSFAAVSLLLSEITILLMTILFISSRH